MKELLKLKWQMHKGVNYLFYGIVIGVGVLIGLGIKKFVIPMFNFELPISIQEFLKKLIY